MAWIEMKDMEVTVNIPRNDYLQPTEVRPEVVQGICEAFLRMSGWSVFHPSSGSNRGYRNPTLNIVRHKGKKEYYGFIDSRCAKDWSDIETTRFNGAEMAAAFKALIEAGYHMYRIYKYDTWNGYVCDKKPFRENAYEVKSFDDFID